MKETLKPVQVYSRTHAALKKISEETGMPIAKIIDLNLYKCIKLYRSLYNVIESYSIQSGEICSKTPFSAVSGDVSARPGEGGLGGGVLNTSTFERTLSYNVIGTATDVISSNGKKNKTDAERTGKGNEKKEKNIYSQDFEKLWRFYPRHEGTSKIAACKSFQNQPVPELEYLIACISLEKEKEQWQDETKIPHLATWLNQRRWEGFEEGKAKARAMKMQGLSAPAKKPEIPSYDEWQKMTMGKQFSVANALGISKTALDEEIERRAMP